MARALIAAVEFLARHLDAFLLGDAREDERPLEPFARGRLYRRWSTMSVSFSLDLVVADAAFLVLLDDVVHDAPGLAAHEVIGQLEIGRARELSEMILLALGFLDERSCARLGQLLRRGRESRSSA